MGEKYSSAGATLGESLPQDGEEKVEGRRLSTVLLPSPDGEQAERDRVHRVVALAQQFAVRFTAVEQVRLAVMDQLSRQRLPTGRRVRLALAAAWSGNHDIAEDMTVALTAQLEAPATERLRELQSHRP